MDDELSVKVDLLGVDYRFTRASWRRLKRFVDGEFAKLKVKCPTCRCMIWPDTPCSCCADTDVEVEPLI